MPDRDLDTAIRVVHDLTQSLWLGGATMGAISIDAATTAISDPDQRIAAADRAWSRWHRISTPAIVTHLVAGAALTYANKGRLAAQRGATATTVARTLTTGIAVAAELRARKLGAAIGQREPHVRTTTEPSDATDPATAKLQRKLKVAQWATVVSTATMIAVGARMSEQQRPRELLRGMADRLHLAA